LIDPVAGVVNNFNEFVSSGPVTVINELGDDVTYATVEEYLTTLVQANESKTFLATTTDESSQYHVSELFLQNNAVPTQAEIDGWDVNALPAGVYAVKSLVTASNGLNIDATTGDVKLGGVLTDEPVTTITTSNDNTLAIAGLQESTTATDRIVVADATTGVLRVKDANASKIVKVDANYTALADDATILADVSIAAFTLTIPTAASSIGRTITIRKVDDTSNLLTFSESIKLNEVDSFTGINYNATIRIQSDGVDWYMID
ncbi:hypothetical protein MM236_19325, partial [Belliella sp. DSM 107340]